MKRIFGGAGLLVAVVWIFAQAQSGNQPLPGLFPGGPLLYLEARDFAALLRDWNGSREKATWLASDNYSVFSRSRLLGRLQAEQDAFAEAAGFVPGMSLADAVAGGQTALAVYDIGKLEFLYITRLPSARTLETLMGKTRTSYESRSSTGRTYFVRRGTASKTVAFAAADGFLLLATREDLVANALALLANQAKVTAVSTDKWFMEAVAASKAVGHVRMVFQMPAITANPYFRSYWVQRNRSALAEYSSGIVDVFREAGQVREERVLLREVGTMANVREAGAGQLAAYAPDDAGLARVWASPSFDSITTLIQTKLVAPGPQTVADRTMAPGAVDVASTAGTEEDLETTIDALSIPSALAPARFDSAFLRNAEIEAMLHVQSSRPLPGGLFLSNESAIVLLASRNWNESVVRAALPTLQVRVQGRLLVLADRLELLEKVVVKSGTPTVGAFAYRAQYRHARELGPFTVMMRSIDAGRDGVPEPDAPREPPFFSGNVASLGRTLGRVESATLSVHDSGTALSQQMIYRLTP